MISLRGDADKNRMRGGHVERGELWWAQIDEKRPVVLLSGGEGPEFLAMQIVEPATPSQKLGFVLMSGEQAVDVDERRRIVEEAGPDARAIGIEVFFGAEEGLGKSGVVRVALPKDGKIFCTWETTVSLEFLIEKIGVLSPAKRHELDIALSLAGRE
jgi:mRNA interferase MazF